MFGLKSSTGLSAVDEGDADDEGLAGIWENFCIELGKKLLCL